MKQHNLRYMTARITSIVGLGTFLLLSACGSTQPAGQDQHVGEKTASQSIGTFAGSDGSEAAPVLGITIDGKGNVLGVEAGSAAQQAGIQIGDELTEIGGTPLGAALAAAAREATLVYGQEVQEIRAHIGQGKQMKVILNRGGRSMTLDIQPGARPMRQGQATPTPVPQNELYM